MMTAVHTAARVQPQASIWSLAAISHNRVLFAVGALLVALSFVYLGVLNTVANRGYEATSLETRLSDLQASRRALELQVAELRATAAIEAKLSQLELVAATAPEYLAITPTQVAVR